MSIVKWSEIEAFHNVRKYCHSYPHHMCGADKVQYRAKVKLHGTNAAVQIHPDSHVVAQSRTAELTPGKGDNAGFAAWVASQEARWEACPSDLVIFGEWCGPGIQKGVAINQIPGKAFVVFAARSLEAGSDVLIVQPTALEKIVPGLPGVYVLPWAEPTLEIPWLTPPSDLEGITRVINEHVEAVEKCDPWVEATFQVKGTGEGLVFYPVSNEHLGVQNFSNLAFKAKGEAHRVVKAKTSAQVEPEVAASVDQFVAMVLTEARLDQGATTVNATNPNVNPVEFDKRLTGKFMAWIEEDIKKETRAELEASGLTYEQVQKALVARARRWYLGKS